MMKLNKLFLTAIAGSLFFVSCSSDDDSSVVVPEGDYAEGTFILNQGGFNHGDAEVSFLSNDNVLTNGIYGIVNGANNPLGDTAQDMGFNGELAYIVLNNSHIVEVVNRYTFAHVATIEDGLDNPRYIAFHDGKAYVTNWGDGMVADDDFIAVIDLSTNTVALTISVAEGPDRIIEENHKLYVAHSGGFNFGNTVSVINPMGNTVEATIPVGDYPTGIKEENGKIYVLASGKPAWTEDETSGKITVINPANNTVVNTLSFSEVTHPENMGIANSVLTYTIGAEVYAMSLIGGTLTLPTDSFLDISGQGAFGISAFASHDNKYYIGDAGDFSANGKVYVYSETGTLLYTHTVGVIPVGFYFN